MKSKKGITLISLVITVVVLGILASVGTYSGVSMINSAKLTAFETELRIMQAEVNDLYDKYRENKTVTVDSVETNVLELGQPITDSNISSNANAALDGAEVANDETIRADYRYFSMDYIAKLGIEGINQDFLVNVKSRKVVSYLGFKYEGERLYTLEQVSNRIYNVDYVENTNVPTFEAHVEQTENNKWKISITNIVYSGNIEKWEVKYQIDGTNYWSTSEKLEFIVDQTGYYNIYINNQEISSSEVKIAVGVAESESADSDLTELSQMLYGVIEIEFLDGTSYRTTNIANTPILGDGMQPVYWVADANGSINTSNPQNNTVEFKPTTTNYNKSNWYQYTAQTGANDGKTSRWANATTSDGSYYVWIPRYAYRIVYFDTETHENEYRAGTLTEEVALANGYITGYSDARGIVDVDGKRPTSVTSTTSISVNDKYFRTHPVFDGNPDEGGWDSKLAGIWVMKYEASRNDADTTTAGSGTTPKSVPNVRVAWININISTMYTYAKNLNITLNSHVMKNSEWGAVAYLAESRYGRNGTEISVNQCSLKIAGVGRGIGENNIYNSTYEWGKIEEEQKYTGTVGQLSSTTGNIYGIYDMSGGIWEFVMGFLQDEDGNIYIGDTASANSGFNGLLNDGTEYKGGLEFPLKEKKYFQLYKNRTNSASDADGGMLGDATKETKGWNNDLNIFLTFNNPVFVRSGHYNNTNVAGSFYFNRNYGCATAEGGFRVCCIVK